MTTGSESAVIDGPPSPGTSASTTAKATTHPRAMRARTGDPPMSRTSAATSSGTPSTIHSCSVVTLDPCDVVAGGPPVGLLEGSGPGRPAGLADSSAFGDPLALAVRIDRVTGRSAREALTVSTPDEEADRSPHRSLRIGGTMAGCLVARECEDGGRLVGHGVLRERLIDLRSGETSSTQVTPQPEIRMSARPAFDDQGREHRCIVHDAFSACANQGLLDDVRRIAAVLELRPQPPLRLRSVRRRAADETQRTADRQATVL